jgi:hypothetical protein
MNYRRIYDEIINFRKINSCEYYYEEHHIVPRSLGGNDTKENLVFLTSREHFICHYLLTKIYKPETFEWYKMNHAFMCMKSAADTQQRYYNSRLYESKRKNFSRVMSVEQTGEKNSQFGTQWIYNEILKKNKKIPTNITIPDGWKKGRKVSWDTRKKECKVCHNLFDQKTKELFCSESCKEKSNLPTFYGREDEFISIYKKTKSMNKTLKQMGYVGAVAYYYKWAKQIVENLKEK